MFFSCLRIPKELQPRQLLERKYEDMKHTSREQASVENIYRLEGRVPVGKAIPFGLQHVLAMFVSNVAPIILVASVALYNGVPFTAVETARLIQNAMMIAGIGTLIQLYPIWKVGSGLPVVMGVSFTFVSAMMVVAARDYGLMVGAIIVGGCIEGVLGLAVGYIAAICFGMVDFSSIGSTVEELGIISLPMLLHYTPKFQLGAIISVTLVFLVSAAETIGDTTAVCTGGLGRDITEKELSGSLCCDGFISAVSGGLFGCTPITSFSQNVGLVAMTKVVNRFTIMFGALTLVIAGLFPPIGAFFSTLPSCVLGGCTVIMFGAIIVSGVTMLGQCGLDQRNTLIAAASFAIGIGVTQVDGFFSHMPQVVGDIFSGNPVAGVFVVSMLLSLLLPKKVDLKDIDALTAETLEKK